MKNNSIYIGKGNSKIGTIPVFDLPPGLSCIEKSCYKICYARNVYVYKHPKVLWDNNFEASKDKNFVKTVCGMLQNYNAKFFRIHSSGDFYSLEYLKKWIDICKTFPSIQFLAFTKAYNHIIDCITEIPENLTIIFSLSPFISHDEKEKIKQQAKILSLSIATIDDTEETGGHICPGSCADCKVCWSGKKNIRYHLHGFQKNIGGKLLNGQLIYCREKKER